MVRAISRPRRHAHPDEDRAAASALPRDLAGAPVELTKMVRSGLSPERHGRRNRQSARQPGHGWRVEFRGTNVVLAAMETLVPSSDGGVRRALELEIVQ